MTLDYTLIRSFRRTLSLQISREGSLIVRAPRLMPVFLIEKFITEKTAWIEKNQEKVRSKIREKTSYTDEEIQEMKKRLREYILPRVEELWGEQNLQKYTSIKITKSEGRWGSCSARNGLCFSYRLAEHLRQTHTDTQTQWSKSSMSEAQNSTTVSSVCVSAGSRSDFIDAIIVHELAHLREKNHQKPFWDLVYRMMPDYEKVMKNRDIGE